MSMPRPSFTNAGRILQLKCINGDTMRLDQAYIVLGDGELTTQAPATLKSVIHEVVRIPVTRIRRTGDHVVVGGFSDFSSLSAGFYWRELAVEIPDPDDGPIAYCYANAFDQADYIDPAANTLERLLTVGLIVSDAANINVTIDESLVFPTYEDVKAELVSKLDTVDRGAVNGVAPLDEAGKVPDGYIGVNLPRMRVVARRQRDPAKPGYGLGGDGPEPPQGGAAALELRSYTGGAEHTAIVSGVEYDALNIGTDGEDIPDGTIIIRQEE